MWLRLRWWRSSAIVNRQLRSHSLTEDREKSGADLTVEARDTGGSETASERARPRIHSSLTSSSILMAFDERARLRTATVDEAKKRTLEASTSQFQAARHTHVRSELSMTSTQLHAARTFPSLIQVEGKGHPPADCSQCHRARNDASGLRKNERRTTRVPCPALPSPLTELAARRLAAHCNGSPALPHICGTPRLKVAGLQSWALTL